MSTDNMPSSGTLAVREKQLPQITGLSRRTIRRAIEAGRFPKPLRCGRCCIWRVADIAAWLDAGCGAVAEGSSR